MMQVAGHIGGRKWLKMSIMELDWRRLRRHVSGELARRGWTQQDLAREAGVAIRTISRLLTGRMRRVPRSAAGVDRALGWPDGRTERLLTDPGYEPAEWQPPAVQAGQDAEPDMEGELSDDEERYFWERMRAWSASRRMEWIEAHRWWTAARRRIDGG
jgi:transcriptional regulator with XRE-family HTH domain